MHLFQEGCVCWSENCANIFTFNIYIEQGSRVLHVYMYSLVNSPSRGQIADICSLRKFFFPLFVKYVNWKPSMNSVAYIYFDIWTNIMDLSILIVFCRKMIYESRCTNYLRWLLDESNINFVSLIAFPICNAS